MSDYSNSFNGAGKDAGNDVIYGVDYDTQFDNIATASTTKANKIIPATTNNVASLSSSGDLQDTGYSFSNMAGDVTSTHTELNIMDGVTASTAELNILVGVTATATEINYSDGVTSAIQPQIDAVTPVLAGSITIWPLGTAPSGYLSCIGNAVSRTTYAALFAVIGTAYGVGDGSTTFNLPDYRGEFLRGYDGALGSDPDAASRTDRGDGTTGDNVGTRQSDEFGLHDHDSVSGYNTLARGNGVLTPGGPDATAGELNSQSGESMQDAGGNETRPRNVSVLFVIKT